MKILQLKYLLKLESEFAKLHRDMNRNSADRIGVSGNKGYEVFAARKIQAGETVVPDYRLFSM